MKTIPFQTKTYVFGQDADGMDAHALIQAIKDVENEITSLTSVKAKSTKIDKMLIELNTAKDSIVAKLDALP